MRTRNSTLAKVSLVVLIPYIVEYHAKDVELFAEHRKHQGPEAEWKTMRDENENVRKLMDA